MKMTQSFRSISVLLVLLLGALTLFFRYTLDYTLYSDLFVLLIVIIVMNFLSTSKNFVMILAISLIIGFFLLFYCFFSGATYLTQVHFVFQHILLIIILVLFGLLFSITKKLQEGIRDLSIRIQELEKYEGTSKLLTPSEFMSRASLISTGTRRRGEENYYILVTLKEGDRLTQDAMHHMVTENLIRTIRSEFDLVTKQSTRSYLVFLQNTNMEGCKIVIDRFLKNLKMQLNLIELPVQCKIIKEDQINEKLSGNRLKGLEAL